jgi:hypothetical protein
MPGLHLPGDGDAPVPAMPEPELVPLQMVPTQFGADNVGTLPDGQYLIRIAFWDATGVKVVYYPSNLAKKIADDIAIAASGLVKGQALPPNAN